MIKRREDHRLTHVWTKLGVRRDIKVHETFLDGKKVWKSFYVGGKNLVVIELYRKSARAKFWKFM